MKKIKIAIDLDDTINLSCNSMTFFSLITNSLKDIAYIYIITNRDIDNESRRKTREELSLLNIHYDKLVITENKSNYILSEGITVFFDDTDENFLDLPESILVFKTREAGNFDFLAKKWIYGDKTGINIDKKRNK